ncbi:hypothetical protein BaRGS_00005464 [Batillaria attramentaria]|uniref:Transmembrane protein 134 n=1 Tax=Batillaria attramentaria TaxID=370345 RepID=A0ABD0LVY2_9CAEN
MATGGHSGNFQTDTQDLFGLDDITREWGDNGTDPQLRIYGATGGSSPLQRPKGAPEVDTDDIPLHDFQLDSHKDPLIFNQSAKSTGHSNTVKSSYSVQSLNSVSTSMTNISVVSYNQYDSWVHHPKVRENWRLVLGSGILMVVGIGLILAGIGIAASPASGYHCIVIIVIGILCLVPGGYHFIYIYCAGHWTARFPVQQLAGTSVTQGIQS